MEKLLSPHDKEYMKMAMLKHEETFKEQVHELHRVYKIQKILMKGIEGRRQKGLNQGRWNSKNGISLDQVDDRHGGAHVQQRPPGTVFDLEQPAEEDYIDDDDDDDVNRVVEIEDESEIVLTLGPTSYCYRRRRKKADDTTPLTTSHSGPSFSSSSTGSNHVMKRTSTASGTQQRREDQLSGHKWGLVEVQNSNTAFQSGIDHVEEQLRQDRLKQSPWLFQALSLNMA